MSNTDFEDLRSAEEANELEEKRQTLHVLVATGSEKRYIGVSLTPARVNKLSEKEVNRYFDLYKIGLGRDTANSLIKSGVGLMVSGLSKLVNVNDPEGLKEELCEDELLRKELQELAGTAIVKGGRLVCLLSLGDLRTYLPVTKMSTEKDLMDKAKEAVIISSFATLSIFLMKKLTGKPAKDPSSSLEGYLHDASKLGAASFAGLIGLALTYALH